MNTLFRIELSEDNGKTWVTLPFPANSHPFHQCSLFGHYEENDVLYRAKDER